MKKEFKNKSILNKKIMTTIYGGNQNTQENNSSIDAHLFVEDGSFIRLKDITLSD
ncbi:hypothetical protein [uncultured Dokdonia sp.]|uniref:hypothetical protein n=1 Tax=uncultured Dokdonia sp. TaxID=575653 RepID=UPI0026043FF1|nr:hypothetical protein [uncultured Dokdonia sp.]